MSNQKDPTQVVLDAVKDLRLEVSELKKKAAAPAYPASATPPWYAVTGRIPGDSEGYSMMKAAALARGELKADQAKIEVDTHQKLKSLYKAGGFTPQSENGSLLVPFSTYHIPAATSEDERTIAETRGRVKAYEGRYDPDEETWVRKRLGMMVQKALGTVSDTAGGVLVGFPTLGELIELQRNLEVFTRAGASEVALPPNGRLQFPKQTSGATAYWVGEAATITDSQPGTGYLDLQAKKLGILVKLNNELIRFTSPTTEAMVRMDMGLQAALKADLAMLTGTGGTQPKGLLEYETQTSWTQGTDKVLLHTASVTGANGDTLQPEDLYLMKGKLPDVVQETDGKCWVMRPNFWSVIANRRADAVTAGDSKGPFVFNFMRDNGGAPGEMLDGDKVIRSSQVPNTRDKGGASNLTMAIYGLFRDWIIGRFGVMEFLSTNASDTAFLSDQTWLRAIQHIDAGPRHLASFIYADDLVIA